MKKINKILTVFILLIISSSLVLAQTPDPSTTTPTTKTTELPKIDSNDPTPKIDEKLEKEVIIPQGLHLITRVGLGINPKEKINVSTLITLISLWISIFIICFSALKTMPSINTIASGISAACLTMIIGSTKAISLATKNWLTNEDFFIFIDGWSFGNLIINLLGITLAIMVTLHIKEKIKKEVIEDKKERTLNKIRAWFSSLGK